MSENEIAKLILDSAFKVHTVLGPGLLESVYEAALAYEACKLGLRVERQAPIPITYESVCLDEAFRADLIVDGKVIVEIKSIERLSGVHSKQLLTYLRLSNKKLGLLLNFGHLYLRDGIERVVNRLEDTAVVTQA